MSALAEKIRACAEQGMSQTEVAAALNRSRPTICQVQKRHGIDLPLARRTRRDFIVSAEAARACAAAGMSMTVAAKTLGVSRETLRLAAKRYGVTFPINKSEHSSVAAYRGCALSGMSRHETATKFGVSLAAVSSAAARHGIDFSIGDKRYLDDRDTRRLWSGKQIETLRQQYSTASLEDLERTLGRGWPAIQRKAYKLGLKRNESPSATIIGAVLSDMEPKHLAWLEAETPEGATLADTIRAIITDAYWEAHE